MRTLRRLTLRDSERLHDITGGVIGEGSSRPIVYIDDDTQSRLLVRRLLEEAGHVVVEATTGLGGIEAALRTQPALILLDIGLPDVDGCAVAAILQTFPMLAATPIVALTAYAVGPGERERTLFAGCDGYITKPIDVDRFAGQIAEFLRGKREAVTSTDLRRLNEQFVARLLAQLDEVRRAKELIDRRVACLERIDEALDDLTVELGVETLLASLLPRLAEAIGAAALAVELSHPPPERIIGRAPRTLPDTDAEAPTAMEWKHALDIAGRSLGFLGVLYSAGGSPSADDEALLRIVTHQVALAIENARLYADEQRLRRDVEAQDRRKDDFLAVLAHELRAPLAPILSAMELLARPDTAPEIVTRAQEVIERQVRYQAALLDDLLDLTRIARDTIELRRELVDLRSVVAAAVEVSRPSIEERGHAFTISRPDEPALVMADPIRLEQVIINLLANAAKYTPIGGTIALTLERSGDLAVITVRDSGEGISSDLLDRVFDPFVRAGVTDRRPRPRGLGIGLALSRRLVGLHGGSIEARSAGPGRGSEFIVRLPLAAGLDETGATPPAVRPALRATPTHVLLVEDDADTRDMLRFTLERAGHRVAVTDTGRDAIQRATELDPEVMLVDLGLPDVDGHEVARQVRARTGQAIFLVALTGYGQAEDVLRAEQAGFDAHVLKPATAEALASVFARRRRRASPL
jgi:signal transduction histidine kinase/chemotaxis response regulator CheB